MADATDKAPMTREKLASDLTAEVSTLREFTELATKLLADVTATINRGDVTFTTLEETKKINEAMKGYRDSVAKVRGALKARMTQRTKEV